MIIRLAWRSIWRHKRRTIITVISIAFGLALAVFLIAWGNGIYSQMTDDAVRMQAGHITLEHVDYRTAPSVDLYINRLTGLRVGIEALPEVEETKLLILGQGVAKSGAGSVGVSVIGVAPSSEAKTSPLARRIISGKYLEKTDGSMVIVGSKLARRLNLKTGKKLVITANDASGELVEELCRVKGIFEVGAEEVDGFLVQAPLNFIRRLYRMPSESATQLGVILRNPDDQEIVLGKIHLMLSNRPINAYPWQEIIPDLAAYIKLDRGSNLIFQGILLFLILFTIFNTVLMSVIERQHEFAVLSAIGAVSFQIKLQLFWEAAFIGLIGCFCGLLIGGTAAYAMQVYGLDLSGLYKEGLTVSGFAINTRMYARLTPSLLIWSGGIVAGATVLLSLIPMRRIDRISIVDTLRG
ncbi:MAG: ABC transporter permease [bacterium]